MATDDPAPQEPEPPPALADWWVWGVRKIAGVVAELLMISRGFALLLIVLKLISWALTRDNTELYLAGAGVAAFFGVWGIARLLGHFSWARQSPDPERWLTQRQQR
jgi:hypothetical protein